MEITINDEDIVIYDTLMNRGTWKRVWYWNNI